MFKVLFSRLLQSLVVLFLLYTITFFMLRKLPGNPLTREKAMPEHIAKKMNNYYGLDKPLIEQYGIQLGNFIKGDPGYSFRLEGKPVIDIISQAFPVSFQLGVIAMSIAIAIGIPAGCIAAARKNGLIDNGAMAVAMLGICLPSFVSGPILAEWLGRDKQLMPAYGWDSLTPSTWFLPALTLGLAYAAYLSRLSRAGMLDMLSQDFVRTARAKGVPGWKILVRHCLRGGMIPAVAYIGPAFAGIISGSLVIETVFQVPGLGRHFIKSIETRDYPVILGVTMLYGALVIIANFLTDVVSVWLNPRLKAKS
ncbi:MAG TPA: ABC transporter permease [Haloferula sp.]